MANKGAFVTCKIDMHKLNNHINRHIDEISDHIIERLSFIGDESVGIARDTGSYKDHTGNLRSSIGYVILKDGQPVVNGKPQRFTGSKGSGAEGAAAADSLLELLRGKYPKGIVLIVCAGMKYAAYVEEVRHRNVLASAEMTARSLVKQLLHSVIS